MYLRARLEHGLYFIFVKEAKAGRLVFCACTSTCSNDAYPDYGCGCGTRLVYQRTDTNYAGICSVCGWDDTPYDDGTVICDVTQYC